MHTLHIVKTHPSLITYLILVNKNYSRKLIPAKYYWRNWKSRGITILIFCDSFSKGNSFRGATKLVPDVNQHF